MRLTPPSFGCWFKEELELDHEEGWAWKNWCFQTVVLEKPLESPLDSKVIKPVNPKGNQPWISIGRTDAEAEALILWLPESKSWLIEKDPDAGKNWGHREKGMTEDEMVRWHHRLNGHEFEQTLRRTGKPGMLQSWGRKELVVLNCAREDSWESPWTARSNQSILKEINAECSSEGLMLKLKL